VTTSAPSPAFGAYARYYDLLYAGKDYAAEAQYVHQLIQRHRPGGTRLIDVGCGTGAHGAELARLGYRLLGIDASPEMLAAARERAVPLPADHPGSLDFAEGDARSFRSPNRFDVATSLFHVMSYQTGNDDVAAAFATVAAHLEPGGLFIFDFWYGPGVLTDLPAVRVRRLEDEHTRVLRIAEPVLDTCRNVVDGRYEIRFENKADAGSELIRETHCMRYFFLPELEVMLRAAGFEWLEAREWMSDRKPSQQSWNTVVCCRLAMWS
jgi:SAM-dependent methyltransferase